MRASTNARGFTLIEVLIVVLILGVLAAIVIPQFTDATQETMDTNLRANLQTVRAQIQLFNAQFQDLTPTPPGGRYDSLRAAPGDSTFWDDLVDYNYLQQRPRNPFSPVAEAEVVGAAPAGAGWVWVQASEELLASDGMGGFFVE